MRIQLRRLVAIASAGILVLAMSSVVPAAAAKPATSAHFVTGNYIAEGFGMRAVQRFEGRTDALGRVVFGYYEHTQITGPDVPPANGDASKATVESIRFFTLESGAPAAELFGTECWYLGAAAGYCGAYHIIVSDGDPVGQPDTFCGGPDIADPDPCFTWVVVSGNVAIY